MKIEDLLPDVPEQDKNYVVSLIDQHSVEYSDIIRTSLEYEGDKTYYPTIVNLINQQYKAYSFKKPDEHRMMDKFINVMLTIYKRTGDPLVSSLATMRVIDAKVINQYYKRMEKE